MIRLTHSPTHRLTLGLLCLLLAGCHAPQSPISNLKSEIPKAAPADFCLTLAWDASPDPDVTGYRLHWGNAPRTYTNSIGVANVTTQRVCGLNPAARYYFAATATGAGLESDFSNEVAWSNAPTIFAISTTIESSPDLITWTNWKTLPVSTFTNPAGIMFFRSRMNTTTQ